MNGPIEMLPYVVLIIAAVFAWAGAK